MRVLVLGATGMLGHKLMQRMQGAFEIAGTIRTDAPEAALRHALPYARFYQNVSAEDVFSLQHAINDWRADVVVNCIGIIKQTAAASDPIAAISINALLPHQLARLTAERGAKLIQFSTDCVFSGRRGNYIESDPTDPVDLYGHTKLLGEVSTPCALTLRTSIVGRELRGHLSLIDWFLSQRGKRVNGYAGALYTGLTTSAMADLISWLLRDYPDLHGLWHVSSDPISKFELLQIVNRVYDLKIELVRDEAFVCDRRLDSTAFRKLTGWQPASWPEMIAGIHVEDEIYAHG